MILVCGEALVDLFVSQASDGSLKTEAILGGSPFNVAIALARQGEKAAFLGAISGDCFGAALKRRLLEEAVDLSYIIPSERLTTLSVVSTDKTGHPSYSFHGDGKADQFVSYSDLPERLPYDLKAIVFGSYTIAVSPAAEAYLALAKRERANRVICLDPNLRATVTPDIKSWRRHFEQFTSCASIIKASDEDIALGYGGDINEPP